VMPGFTHLQTAQPVTWGHHMMAYVEMFGRDLSRVRDARARMNECPLGAAALASENKQRAIRFVRKFSADGETWTDHALEAAFAVPDARTIVLLSDGMPFRSKEPIDCFDLLDQVDAWNRFEHKQVNTIGFANTAHEVGGFLQELSRRNGGSYAELP